MLRLSSKPLAFEMNYLAYGKNSLKTEMNPFKSKFFHPWSIKKFVYGKWSRGFLQLHKNPPRNVVGKIS